MPCGPLGPLLVMGALGVLVSGSACGGGGPCISSAQCTSPDVCVSGSCRPPAQGVNQQNGFGGPPSGTTMVGDSCGGSAACVADATCYQGYCVGEGPLRVSLHFTADTDLDLHVLTPSGQEIYYGRRSAGGGVLDVDQCIGSCTAGESHVENVVFTSPVSGVYQVQVVNYDGRSAATSTVDVSTNGMPYLVFSDSLPATAGALGLANTFSY